MGMPLAKKVLLRQSKLKMPVSRKSRRNGCWHPGLARQVLYLIARQFSCLCMGWHLHPTGKGREIIPLLPWPSPGVGAACPYPGVILLLPSIPLVPSCASQVPSTDGSKQGEQSLFLLFSILHVPGPCISLVIPCLTPHLHPTFSLVTSEPEMCLAANPFL